MLRLPQLRSMIGRDVVITVEAIDDDPEWAPRLWDNEPQPGLVASPQRAKPDAEAMWDIGGEGGD